MTPHLETESTPPLERITAPAGPAPHVHPDVEGFWTALDAGRLVVQRCDDCGVLRFPVSTHCHGCLSDHYTWEPIEPSGTVSVAVRAHEAVSDLPASGVSLPDPWRAMTPYLTGAVDMAAGIRLPGRIICWCESALTPGAPVRAVLLDGLAGTTVYGFVHDCE